MRISSLPVEIALLAAVVPGFARAIELQPATLQAWQEYIRSADGRMASRLGGQQTFLWSDENPANRQRLLRGEVLIAPAVGHGTRGVPNGLIHHWVGAMFIPGATIDRLFAVVHDYDRYKEVYRPVVADSKVIACTESDQQFAMTWQHRILFVDAAMEGQYRARDVLVDGRRGYNIADTTEVREIVDYGHPGERLLPPGEGNGFIWRMHSIARFEERDGGVYFELEAVALTRDVPVSLRWMVNPVVNHISVNSLKTTLEQTRDAVKALPPVIEQLASCSGGRHERAARGGGAD